MSTAQDFFSETKASKNPTIFRTDPDVLAQEIVVDLESAFEPFSEGSFAPPCLHYSSRCFVLYNPHRQH